MDYNLLPKSRHLKLNRPEKVILICYFDPNGISTIIENIRYLQLFSSLSIDVYNLYGQQAPFHLKKDFTLQKYDVIVFHNTVTCHIECLNEIDSIIDTKLSEYDGLKVLFKQDEHILPNNVSRFIGKIKADVVFSCLPKSEYRKVYLEEITGEVTFVNMLTGYVSPNMRHYTYSQLDSRPIDIGYRGSLQPIYYGRLAFEKQQIAYDFLRFAEDSNIVLDISYKWEDRLNGEKWIKFLANSKATLGAESGASIFDFYGEVENRYKKIVEEIGENPEDREWSEKILNFLSDFEGYIKYNQISPRHFEAAATRTLQFLYRGEYSGIFSPYKHYIPVDKNISNFNELVSILKDEKTRHEITQCAYEEIILNKNFWIENFAKSFDQEIIGALSKKGTRLKKWYKSRPSKINVLLICGHKLNRDPRIHWISEFAPQNTLFHLIGLHDNPEWNNENLNINKYGGFEIDIYRKGFRETWPLPLAASKNIPNIGISAISLIRYLAETQRHTLMYILGVEDESARFNTFRWYLSYFYDTAAALVFNGTRFRGIDIIIATDLDTLAAGIVLKEYFNASLIYDAHEYWPESDVESSNWESSFWNSYERFLLNSVDFSMTISTNLAEYMSN
jgi:hypothetical protein